ncbi:Hypothetical predicted protein [Olea europaea subsp. europaea]|uniref:Uncharacterized protein n=1 Tax=Olea europaea subsp. europaea TaxID=158383 RepID=A0A8S0UYM7_OLEEU|nr:Hypothetical predicted protein [Olea europaea subsp. europaea]
MSEEDKEQSHLELLSIPDGLQTEEDRKNGLLESLRRTMPGNLTRLIEKINCVIADTTLIEWILDVPKKVGAETVAFQPGATADMALVLQIPKLIQLGNLDANGSIMKNEMINLSSEIPSWRNSELPWGVSSGLKARKMEQFHELALALELCGRPFLWVFRSNFANPNGFVVDPFYGFSARTLPTQMALSKE